MCASVKPHAAASSVNPPAPSLNQMYSVAYGTVPIVRKTGGLADTVVDCSGSAIADRTANGFCFDEFDERKLEAAIQRALDVFHGQPQIWKQLVETGMNSDWSWKASAVRYVRLYEQTVEYFQAAQVAAPE